jgi:8-oxo-dGTP pyrophosphatase MutT (NUDIX family)
MEQPRRPDLPSAPHPGQIRGPWKVLDTREVYRNPWIRVREDQVLRPDGHPGIYGVIETEPAVAIVALTEDERVYLVGQYRYPTQTYAFEVISGFAEAGEELLAAAQRELREEAKLQALKWVSLGRSEISNSVTDQVGFVWLARGLSPCDGTPEGTEELTLKTLPLAEAVRAAQSGEIHQALTVVALFRAWHYLRGELKN